MLVADFGDWFDVSQSRIWRRCAVASGFHVQESECGGLSTECDGAWLVIHPSGWVAASGTLDVLVERFCQDSGFPTPVFRESGAVSPAEALLDASRPVLRAALIGAATTWPQPSTVRFDRLAGLAAISGDMEWLAWYDRLLQVRERTAARVSHPASRVSLVVSLSASTVAVCSALRLPWWGSILVWVALLLLLMVPGVVRVLSLRGGAWLASWWRNVRGGLFGKWKRRRPRHVSLL